MIAPPGFDPDAGVAGMQTTVVFDGDVLDGDVVVMKPDNCDGAAATVTGSTELGPTELSTSEVCVGGVVVLVSHTVYGYMYNVNLFICLSHISL